MLLLPAKTPLTPAEYTDHVFNMDALEYLRLMPSESVDIVVTSPPYNLKRKNKTATGFMKGRGNHQFVIGGSYDKHDDDMPELEYQEWMRKIVQECLRVSKGLVWINHKTRYQNGEGIHPLRFLPFPLWSEVVWNRRGSITMNARKFAPSHEYVFGFGRPHYWNNDSNTLMTVWAITRGSANDDSEHPCPFPVELVLPLIEASCPPDGIVLDPFAGSGTTGVAALRLKRHYSMNDHSPVYCQVAERRLAVPFTLPMVFEVRELAELDA